MIIPPPVAERSTAMGVSVCLCVCLSVLDHYLRNYTSDLHQILRMLPTAAARSFCGDVMTRDVFPVLWMTSYLHIS